MPDHHRPVPWARPLHRRRSRRCQAFNQMGAARRSRTAGAPVRTSLTAPAGRPRRPGRRAARACLSARAACGSGAFPGGIPASGTYTDRHKYRGPQPSGGAGPRDETCACRRTAASRHHHGDHAGIDEVDGGHEAVAGLCHAHLGAPSASPRQAVSVTSARRCASANPAVTLRPGLQLVGTETRRYAAVAERPPLPHLVVERRADRALHQPGSTGRSRPAGPGGRPPATRRPGRLLGRPHAPLPDDQRDCVLDRRAVMPR